VSPPAADTHPQKQAPPGPASAEAGPARAPGGRAELGMAALVVAIGVVVLVGTTQIDEPIVDNVVGPRFFPYGVGALLVTAGVWLAVDVLRGGRGQPDVDENLDPSLPCDWRAVAVIVGAFLAHVLLVVPAGWPVAGAVLFAGVAVALGARLRVAAPVAVLLASVVFAVFEYALGVPLPLGMLDEVV
jgi:putative tricarboxylic transport membrane protein